MEPVTLGTGPERDVSKFRGGAEVQTGLTCGPAEDRNGLDQFCAEQDQIGPDQTGLERYIPVMGSTIKCINKSVGMCHVSL